MTPDRLAPGRPRLVWAGKHRPRAGDPLPVRAVEVFPGASTGKLDAEGILFHGDNLEAMHHLLHAGYGGTIKLVYIDPPFDSGADYARRIRPRGDGDWLGEQTQYSDVWADDRYLQFMYERLWLLRDLLAEDGALYLHCNAARSHHLRTLLDEVFGPENFRNQIVVRRIRKNIRERDRVPRLNDACDFVFFYARGPAHRVSPPLKRQPREERWHAFDAPNVRPKLEYPLFGHRPPPGRHWLRTEVEATAMTERGDLRAHPRTGKPEYRIPASTHVLRDSLWDDVTAYSFRTGYPTEKKEELLELIVGMSSEPGDLVLDCFLGSGTTAAVAQRMGRRWIGVEAHAGAIGT
ncbi:MAG: site-specific DNA-methyltransferase, partial [Gemmatimonadota bacterium]|nr:site-specific DNA-methyltransferase [Gemmatimonadota bacterium]